MRFYLILAAIGAGAALALSAQASPVAPDDWARASDASVLIQALSAAARSVATAPAAFDPSRDEVLPGHRVVAFYGIPGAAKSGPAYELSSDMLKRLHAQADEYRALDPGTPVLEGIDLVVNVADGGPGRRGLYDHDISSALLGKYLEFCRDHGLLLFLDLELGRKDIRDILPGYLPVLRDNAFVHLAVDPEWAFPQGSGVPGTNIGSLPADDFNYAIRELARLAGPRKILMIHEYRDRVLLGAQEKEKIDRSNARVSVVLHVDGVGGFEGGSSLKKSEYAKWVGAEWTGLGGFKLFYDIEKPFHMMTPADVLKLSPAPLVVTYGN